MKFKINQLVRKPVEIQGRATEIITMMVSDLEKGVEVKVKAWKSKWSDTFEIGKEYAAETYTKKGLDGLDELYLVNPDKGKSGFVRNLWVDAYHLAIEWCKARKELELTKLDEYAKLFKSRLEGSGDVKVEVKKAETNVIQLEEEGIEEEE